ncbi:uncharacterized protein LOC122223806 isoform X3 [Panthera leo]|uniref:uncharacterized protein LOC122223806 isoform X3 n=1 Tax=Panthera leo TaxID=9689 RepID=UPI001C69E27A|nr:uncharacterized protein LOC122223806 isoform X3 [Panthera leo]
MTPVNQEGGLTRHGICQHLHLRLAAPRTVRKKCLLFSPRLWCSVTAARAKTLRWFLLPSLLKDVSSYTDFLVHGHFFPSTSVIPRQLSVFSLLLRRSFVFLSGYTEDLYPVLYTVICCQRVMVGDPEEQVGSWPSDAPPPSVTRRGAGWVWPWLRLA